MVEEEFPPLHRGTPRGEKDPAAETRKGWLESREGSQPYKEEHRL